MTFSPSYNYRIGWLQRLPLRTPYPAVVAAIGNIVRRLPPDTTLLLDNTGIGRAAYDMLQDHGLSPVGVAITAGAHVNVEGHRVSVPKATLVSKLIALTQSGDLSVHADLKDWPTLRRELQNFRSERTPAGNETWSAAPGSHDDLIIATALCGWWLQGGGAHGMGIYRYAAMIAGETGFEEFCVGVDLGQSIDYTAICCMSRLPRVPDPERDHYFEAAVPEAVPEPPPPAVPLGTGQSIEDENERLRQMLAGRRPTGQEIAEHEARLREIVAERGNKTDELLRREAMWASATPNHPEASGGEVEFVNGPRVRSLPQPGSIEWQQQAERR